MTFAAIFNHNVSTPDTTHAAAKILVDGRELHLAIQDFCGTIIDNAARLDLYQTQEAYEEAVATQLKAVNHELEERILRPGLGRARSERLRLGADAAAGTLGQFGYTGAIHFNPLDANATTAGGLSGLVMVTSGGRVPPLLDGGALSSPPGASARHRTSKRFGSERQIRTPDHSVARRFEPSTRSRGSPWRSRTMAG